MVTIRQFNVCRMNNHCVLSLRSHLVLSRHLVLHSQAILFKFFCFFNLILKLHHTISPCRFDKPDSDNFLISIIYRQMNLLHFALHAYERLYSWPWINLTQVNVFIRHTLNCLIVTIKYSQRMA